MTTTDNQKGVDGKEIALEARSNEEDRLHSPSVARNRDVIRNVFVNHMPDMGTLLEVGSGTGEHAAYIAARMADLTWQPSDPDPASRLSIAAWAEYLNLANIRSPLDVDVTADRWFDRTDVPRSLVGMMSVNMIHIAPFEAARGVMTGAGHLLDRDGRLFLYGPFKRNGETAPSNLEFDASLKSRDPRWGVRDLDQEIVPLAMEAGLILDHVIDMPANNLSVIFRK